MEVVLQGNVLWSYAHQIKERNTLNDLAYQFSGIRPYHDNSGVITLTEAAIIISGSENLQIPLSNISQLYLGFDDVYVVSLAKNLGLFWKPMRITLYNHEVIYFIIDYNFLQAKNKKWFESLKVLLS
jgi:hypothetical protein